MQGTDYPKIYDNILPSKPETIKPYTLFRVFQFLHHTVKCQEQRIRNLIFLPITNKHLSKISFIYLINFPLNRKLYFYFYFSYVAMLYFYWISQGTFQTKIRYRIKKYKSNIGNRKRKLTELFLKLTKQYLTVEHCLLSATFLFCRLLTEVSMQDVNACQMSLNTSVACFKAC